MSNTSANKDSPSEIKNSLRQNRTRPLHPLGIGLRKYTAIKKTGKWTVQEDDVLKKHVATLGEKQWRKISHVIPGRTSIQCLHRWSKILKPGLVKGPWTPEEDDILRDWVKKEGPHKWSQAASLIRGRSGKQCRERWFNTLDPDVKKGNWTEEEDQLIYDLYQKHGSSWSKIAKSLSGRTENAIKNRFYSTKRKIVSDRKKLIKSYKSSNRKKLEQKMQEKEEHLKKDHEKNILYRLLQDKTTSPPSDSTQAHSAEELSGLNSPHSIKNTNFNLQENDKQFYQNFVEQSLGNHGTSTENFLSVLENLKIDSKRYSLNELLLIQNNLMNAQKMLNQQIWSQANAIQDPNSMNYLTMMNFNKMTAEKTKAIPKNIPSSVYTNESSGVYKPTQYPGMQFPNMQYNQLSRICAPTTPQMPLSMGLADLEKQKLMMENMILKSQLSKSNFLPDFCSMNFPPNPFVQAMNYQNPEKVSFDPQIQKALQLLRTKNEYMNGNISKQNTQISDVKIEAREDSHEEMIRKKMRLS